MTDLSKEENKDEALVRATNDVEQKEEEKETKEVEKKSEPKKVSKPKAKKKKPGRLVHIDNFIEAIRIRVDMSEAQAQGFKAYMTGNHYAKSLNDFVPYLEKYLGKKVG